MITITIHALTIVEMAVIEIVTMDVTIIEMVTDGIEVEAEMIEGEY